MNPSNAAETAAQEIAPPSAAAGDRVTIETRFGEMAFARNDAITLPRGLFGFADYHDFGIANLPDPRLEQFKLMQCLTEPSLSFIVAPLNMASGTIDAADIDNACGALSIAPENAAVLLIVATRKIGPETQISVNLRAPIIADTASQTAWQHVLNNSRYPVRHVLTQGVRAQEPTGIK